MEPRDKAIEPKIVKILNNTLYFCPICNKGHLLEKGQEMCDLCGVQLLWKGEKGERNKGRKNK